MRSLVALMVCAALVATGCGIPLDSEPQLVEVAVDPAPESNPPSQGESVDVPVFLVQDERLVEVSRELPSPPSLVSIFESLLDGVTEDERDANLRTAIPPDTRVISVTEIGSTLLVDLSDEFASVGGEEELFAVAQIVLTATSIEGIDLVEFQLSGLPTDVPVGSGALSQDPVGFDDYQALVATD